MADQPRPAGESRRHPRRLLLLLAGAALVLAALVAGAWLPGTRGPWVGTPAPTAAPTVAGSLPSQPATAPAATIPPATPAPPTFDPQPTPTSGTAIVPGRVDRTSIDLVATYDVDVDLEFDRGTMRVEASLSVTNASGEGIDRIELNTITGPLGNLRLRRVLVDGEAVDARVDDQTIRVPLGGILPDGRSVTVRVVLRATLPGTLGGSNWLFSHVNGIVQASRWLPWIGLHRPFDRPNHGDPFFTAFSPHVIVRITTDRPLVIAAPGERVAVDGLTQTFEARDVRDFPIVASPSFSIRDRQVGPWTLRAFTRPGFPTATVLDQAADALERMSELAGDYSYPVLTIAQTAGGYALEGPGMIWIPTGFSGSTLRWNVYHEVAHQWFYGMVGSDHALDPFADEAVATHLGNVVSGIWRTTSCRERRLDLSIYRYSNACYFGQVYVHGSELLQEVRRTMGSGTYWRAIRAYVAEHHFRIGSTRALLDTFQAHTGANLRPLLEPRFPSLF